VVAALAEIDAWAKDNTDAVAAALSPSAGFRPRSSPWRSSARATGSRRSTRASSLSSSASPRVLNNELSRPVARQFNGNLGLYPRRGRSAAVRRRRPPPARSARPRPQVADFRPETPKIAHRHPSGEAALQLHSNVTFAVGEQALVDVGHDGADIVHRREIQPEEVLLALPVEGEKVGNRRGTRPPPRNFSMSGARVPVTRVTLRPTMRSGAPDSNTTAAASGSLKTFASPTALMLPTVVDPPITVISLSQPAKRGSRFIATATLVAGPTTARPARPCARARSRSGNRPRGRRAPPDRAPAGPCRRGPSCRER
jgi:hypothetical protein